MSEYYEDTALLPDNWHAGEDIFAAPPDGPPAPPGGSGIGVQAAAETDLTEQVKALQSLYPDFTEMPEEVAQAVASGTALKDAYGAWRTRRFEAENAALRTAAAAPVRAVGSSGGEGGDPFLLGFDHEAW